jgi:glycosyltransferase involved in cell wall biosynthesis
MTRHRGRRILIDGSMARGGGGFTYLVNILPKLAAIAPDHQFRVLVRSERLARSIAVPRANLAVEQLPEANWLQRFRFTYFDLPRLLRAWGADLCFSAGESAPLRAPCPMIACFRNPIPYAPVDPALSGRMRLRLRVLYEVSRVSSRTCERIMFVSHDSARWIGDLFGLPASRRAVVHHGIDAAAFARPDPPGPAPHPRPYILSVSSVHRHKNYVRLIEAYAALARRRDELPDLVIIGDDQDPEYFAEMRAARIATGAERALRIHILGEVPYAEIKRYYASAELFVFPSYLETFGHPMLEAMASGTPIVAADTPVFHEIGADAALYADPYKSDVLSAAIEEALFNPRTREALIRRGSERARVLSWDATARNLLALFDEVLSERSGPGA